jgi:hypothetical protein
LTVSYPPQSRYNQPDYPEQGYSDHDRGAQRRYPEPGSYGEQPRRGATGERPEYRTGGQPQQRYSAPPAAERAARWGGGQDRYDPARYEPGYSDDDYDDDDDLGPVKKRTGLKVFVIVLGAILVLCSGVLSIGALTIHDSYPADVALGDTVAGLGRIDDPDLQSGAEDVVAALKTGRGVREAVAGVYAKDGDAQHPIMILAAAGLFLRPEKELLSGMTEFNTDGFSLDEPLDIEPGPLGGAAKCSLGALQVDEATSIDFILCGWADYGSIGLAGFFNTKESAAAADMVVEIRKAVETH